MATMTADSRELYQSLLAMDRLKAEEVARKALYGSTPLFVVEELVGSALDELGRAWERGDAALSQVYMGSRICERLIDSILPPASPERHRQPKLAIAVLNDHHVLGKRIVFSTIRAAGYDLLDFGTLDAPGLQGKAVEHGVEVLLVSTLMLSSALEVRALITGLRRSIPGIKVIVGGAPFRFDRELWKEVGADAMGSNASDGLVMIHRVSGGRRL